MAEFIRPVEGSITCSYSCHKARDTGDPNNRIYGTDIARADIFRKPALCMKGGVVTFSGAAGTAGNMVEIDSGDCWHRYLHLDSIQWTKGTVVPQGAMVGLIGTTGNSTGPHLHVDLRFKAQAPARRIMEPDYDAQPWGWNVDPELAWSKQEDDMANVFKMPGRPEQYHLVGGKLTHIPTEGYLLRLGSPKFVEVVKTDALWNSPVEYPAGVPKELRG